MPKNRQNIWKGIVYGEEALDWSEYAVCELPNASSVLAKMQYYDKGFLCHSDSKGTEVILTLSRKGKKLRGNWGTHLMGILGCICLVLAGAGLWYKSGEQRSLTRPTVEFAGLTATEVEQTRTEEGEHEYYPLEVGRYWIYQRLDPLSGTTTELERRIVRRESREGRDVYFFDDETVAYREGEKVFEMGPEGGVNVVLADGNQATPYVYRSQGLHIKKQISNRDTVLEIGSLRYKDCIQIVTHFRKEQGAQVMSYASYYSPGIGLVGREMWPPNGDAPTEILLAFGMRKL